MEMIQQYLHGTSSMSHAAIASLQLFHTQLSSVSYLQAVTQAVPTRSR